MADIVFTNVALHELSASSAEILIKHDGMQEFADKWQSATEEFHGHAGDDGVDGQLKAQSQTSLDDNKRGSEVATKRAKKSGESGQEATVVYSGKDQDHGADIATVGDSVHK